MRAAKQTAGWLLVAVLVVGVVACGDDGGSGGQATTAPPPSASPSTGAPGTTTPSDGEGPAPQPLAERRTVRAAIVGTAFEVYAQMMLADHFGEFEKENIDLELASIPPVEQVALLQSGGIDVGALGANIPVLNAIASGADLRVVTGLAGFSPRSKQGYWVRSDLTGPDGSFDPCDFEGLTVSLGGVSGYGSTSVLAFSDFVEPCGLGIDDVTLSTLGGADALIALENGSIDAALVVDPFWSDPDERGYADLVIPLGERSPNGYVMGAIRHDPEVAEAIVRALVRTTRTYLQGDYHDDPEVLAALSEAMQAPPEAITAGLPLVFDPDMAFPVELVEPLQEVWIGVGDLLSYTEPLPLDQVVDESARLAVVGRR